MFIHIVSVDGGFTTWSNYGSCSKPCGIGYHERTRSCTNPPPAHGGYDCVGERSESRQCKVKECPGMCMNFAYNVFQFQG